MKLITVYLVHNVPVPGCTYSAASFGDSDEQPLTVDPEGVGVLVELPSRRVVLIPWSNIASAVYEPGAGRKRR